MCQSAHPLANLPGLRHIENMAVPLDLLRAMLALLCLFFAHFLGRSIVRVRRGVQKPRHLYGWLIRALITAAVIFWRGGWDAITIASFALSAGSLGLGIWMEQRPRQEEDLTREIFRV